MAFLPGCKMNLIRRRRGELLSSMISNPGGVRSFVRKINRIGLLFPDDIKVLTSLTNDDGAVAILNHLEIILEISFGYIPLVIQVLKEHSFLTDTIAIEDDTDMLTANEFMYFSRKKVAKQEKKILAPDGELTCNSEFDLETQAENVQKLFNQVYPVTIRALNDGNVNNAQLLKAQLNVMMQFNAEQSVSSFLRRLETKNTSGEIFHLLMTRKYLGFLNLQFLPLFEPFLPDDLGNEIYHKIEVCRKQHREFFSNSILNLAELFEERGDLLNPASGLPKIKFTLQLDKWGEKSFMQWNNLLVKLCGWPDCFLFEHIEEIGTTFFIEYSILPFMVSRVVNTFLDKEISQTFENFGVSYDVVGTDLERKAADETAWIHASVQELLKKISSNHDSITSSSEIKKKGISQPPVTDFQFGDSTSSAGGFQRKVFVNLPPTESLHCCFCKLVMRNPVQTQCCGEAMCQACLQENNSCPDCGIKTPVTTVDKKCEKLIMKLEVQCIEENCDWKGTLADYESHHVKEYHNQKSFNKSDSSNDENRAKPQQNVSSLVKPQSLSMPKPSKPSASVTLISLPNVVSISDKSITIEWTQTEVQTFNVQFTKKDGPENWNTIQTRDRKVTVQGLTPDTHYLFKIQGQNGCQSSETIEVKTYPGPLPPGRPYSLSIESESIELSWDPPESNLKLKEYQLVVCTIPDHTKCDSFSSMKNNKYIVKNLSPGTEYFFFVKAIYSNGLQSEWSECSKAIRTNIKNIHKKPVISTEIPISLETEPKMKDVTSSSVRLEWRPSDNQAIKKYRVLYSKKERQNWKSIKTQDNTPEINITGLEHSTEYFFKVKAKFLNKQYSDCSEESDAVKTLPICVSPPGIPHAVQCPDGSFEFKWNKPKQGANAVNHYLVQYVTSEMHNEPPDGYWPNFQEQYSSTHAKICSNHLKPGVKYCFKITAICDGGRACSDPTQWIQVKYPPPPAPGMPYATAVEETTIHLKWERPEYEYQIEYNVYCLQTFYSTVTHRLIDNEEAEVTDLKPNKKYRFQIEAVNPDGVSKMGPEGDLITTNRELPSPPGIPYILRVTHDTVKLRWEKPQNGVNTPSHYKIQFKHPGDTNWTRKKIKKNDCTNYEVDGLQPSAEYVFKVSACYRDGTESVCSNVSESVTLKSAVPSAPGKPVGKPDSSNPDSAVKLTWSKPQIYADQIKCYEISYYEDGAPDADNRKTERTKEVVEKFRINKLTPGKGYYFEVRAVTHGGEKSEPSFLSDLITNESLAETFLNSCTRITEAGSIPVYKLPVKKVHKDKEGMFIKYDVALGQGMPNRPKDKVLMLVGPTGSGKTTIINGLMNYILRVQYGDEFRYKLIHDTDGPQVMSVMSHITAYKIYCETGFPVSFNLTIIDTPGFGDTRGIERDRKITKQVKEFFEMNNGIPHLDGIGFVCQAGSVRLTPTQQFIFDSIFAMFGNDVKDNIFVLCTFCDGEKPAVINAVKEAEIPVEDDTFLKFNNSALYAANTSPITEFFWNIGIESYRDFLVQFEKARPVSLRLTKEILQERETLETIMIGLQERITDEINLINQLKNEIKILEKNRVVIEDNKEFEYEVDEDVMVKVDLERGVYTTNCLTCNITCHCPCTFGNNDQDKTRCSVMNQQGSIDASCKICPGKCHWSHHHNASFKLVTERKKVKKIYEQTKRKYENALNDKLTVENVIEQLKCEIDEAFEAVFQMIQQTNECTQKLDQIAFRPNHLSDTEYIQLLIEAQLQEKREGYQECIEAYRVLKEMMKLLQEAKMISNRTKADQWDRRWWEKFYM